MKKSLLITALLLLAFFINYAQETTKRPLVPQAIKYQAVPKDFRGAIMPNEGIGTKITIFEKKDEPLYIEVHKVETDEFGTLTLEIGRGHVEKGVFSEIAWLKHENLYIHLEMWTPAGPIVGITELLSVPYAFAAENAYYSQEARTANIANYATLAGNAENCAVWEENGDYTYNTNQSVGVGTSIEEPSAILEANSTTKGFLPPRMNTEQREAIENPAIGLQVYNIETNCLNYFTGDVWFEVCGAAVTTPEDPCNGVVSFEYGGQTYNTVAIGNQCWMKENLNIGTMVNSDQTDNGIIEKICYNNNETNCDEYGAIYQFNELMQYDTTEGGQGLCPDGWHVPTDNEWKILEMSLGMSQSEADAGFWRGTDEGTQLKEGGSSGFEAKLAGITGFSPSNSSINYTGLNSRGDYWSSTLKPGTCWHECDYYTRMFTNDSSQIYRLANDRQFGKSVRCIKD